MTAVELNIETPDSQNLRRCVNFFNDINFFNCD